LFHRFAQRKQLSIHSDSRRFKKEMSTVSRSNVYLPKRASVHQLTGSDRIYGKAKAPGKIVKGPQRYDQQWNGLTHQSGCHFSNRAVAACHYDQIDSFAEQL
jgi:hypothetical protein